MAWRLIPEFTLASRGGVCSVCGTEAQAKEHGVLSPDIYIEGEGDFDICGNCIKEGAHLLGWVSPDEVLQVEADLEELRQWAAAAYPEIEGKDQIISTLSAALAKTAAERDVLRAEVAA